jgi:hypothetical protein
MRLFALARLNPEMVTEFKVHTRKISKINQDAGSLNFLAVIHILLLT